VPVKYLFIENTQIDYIFPSADFLPLLSIEIVCIDETPMTLINDEGAAADCFGCNVLFGEINLHCIYGD
jgi:hypothetical protein